MIAIPQEAYDKDKGGVLDQDYHRVLVQNIEGIAAAANIPATMILSSMTEFCSPEEIEFVRQLHTTDKAGLVYSATESAEPLDVAIRMQAVAGACIRNYINAKYMPLATVLAGLKNETLGEPTVLLIPDFYVAKNKAGAGVYDMANMSLLSMLFDRHSRGLKTIVGIENADKMGEDYGLAFNAHFLKYYKMIKV